MALPLIAIVGRPNVGKSTLFNHLLGRRRAIVEDTPGVTRDRLIVQARLGEHTVLLADTGGLGGMDDPLEEDIARQAEVAVEAAHLILHVLDAREGLQAGDVEISHRLRRARAPVVTVANKCDGVDPAQIAADFAPLGIDEILAISALHGISTQKLSERLTTLLPAGSEPPRVDLSLAVVGRPNVGKSSLVNVLVGEERMVVSDLPGTTRDAVDSTFAWQGKQIRIIDTAGLRKKHVTREGIERYSALRALSSILEAEVTVLLIDATVGCQEQEQKIAAYLAEHHRACVIAINKWDQVAKSTATHDEWVAEVRDRLPFLSYAPVVTISVHEHQRIHRLLETACAVAEKYHTRLSTARVNAVIERAVAARPPPRIRGKRPRIYYASQIGVAPPTVVLFMNRPQDLSPAYRRYLIRRLSDELDLTSTPIHLVLRQRQ